MLVGVSILCSVIVLTVAVGLIMGVDFSICKHLRMTLLKQLVSVILLSIADRLLVKEYVLFLFECQQNCEFHAKYNSYSEFVYLSNKLLICNCKVRIYFKRLAGMHIMIF